MKSSITARGASREIASFDAGNTQIVPANFADVKDIKAIIDPYAARDLMLPRTTEEIFENIREYLVYRIPSGVIGCVALHIFSPELAEVRALAVHSDYTSLGHRQPSGRRVPGRSAEFRNPEGVHAHARSAFLCEIGLSPGRTKHADAKGLAGVLPLPQIRPL